MLPEAIHHHRELIIEVFALSVAFTTFFQDFGQNRLKAIFIKYFIICLLDDLRFLQLNAVLSIIFVSIDLLVLGRFAGAFTVVRYHGLCLDSELFSAALHINLNLQLSELSNYLLLPLSLRGVLNANLNGSLDTSPAFLHLHDNIIKLLLRLSEYYVDYPVAADPEIQLLTAVEFLHHLVFFDLDD